MTDLFDGIFATARIRLFSFCFLSFCFFFFYTPIAFTHHIHFLSWTLLSISRVSTRKNTPHCITLYHRLLEQKTSLIEFRSDKFWWSAHILVSESSFKWHIFMFKFSSEIQLVCDGRTVGRTDRRTDGRTDEHTFLLRLENASTQEGKDNE